MFRLYRLRDYNFRLIIYLGILSFIGILLVTAADPTLRSKQIAGVAAGFAIMIVLSLFDYSWLLHFYWPAYVINAGMLTLVLLFGSASHGAARWVEFGGLRFQPTELSKILLILFFSMLLMYHRDDLNQFKVIGRILLLLAFQDDWLQSVCLEQSSEPMVQAG